MAAAKFYGSGFPYKKNKNLPGKLIVVEGTDGVGRSTQVGVRRQGDGLSVGAEGEVEDGGAGQGACGWEGCTGQGGAAGHEHTDQRPQQHGNHDLEANVLNESFS